MTLHARFLLPAPDRHPPVEGIYDTQASDDDVSSNDFVRSLTPDEHSPTPAIVTIGPCSSDHIRNVVMWELRSDDDDDSNHRTPGPDTCATNGHDSASLSTVDDCEAARKPSSGCTQDSTFFRPREPTDNNLFHITRNSSGGSSLGGTHAEDLDFLRRHFSSSRTRRISDDKSCSENETSW